MPVFKVLLLKKVIDLQNAHVFIEAADSAAALGVADKVVKALDKTGDEAVAHQISWESDGLAESSDDIEHSVLEIEEADPSEENGPVLDFAG
jgi:hypothetical protein